MALAKGTNSYGTVAEADSYFEDRLDRAAWTNADDDQKAQALVTATSTLDDMSWTGVAVSESQYLAFPRSGSYFDPRIGTEVTLDESEVPTRIVNATFEMAYHYLNNDGLLDNVGSVTDIEVGRITLKNIVKPSSMPSHIQKHITPLLVNGASNTWWRAW